MKKNGKQRSLVKIVKNKEILIYKNGKKYKRFKHSETKNLNENEMYILDYLLNKYMGYEVDLESGSENDANIDNNDNNFELNSNDELSQSNQKIKNTFQSNGDEDEEKIESSTLKQIKNKKNKNNANDLYQEEEDNFESSISKQSKKVKNKKKSNRLYEEEIGESMESSKAKKVKDKKNKNYEKSYQSLEEEEELEMEESIESNENIPSKKNKKKKKKKKINDSDDEDEGGEEIIKRRIIKRTTESNNKNPKQSVTKVTCGDVVEIKHLNNKTKTTKIQKSPKPKKNQKKESNNNSEENIDIEIEEKKTEKKTFKKPEYIPQYITQLQSYTSPTIKFLDEKKAEDAVLNGITSSLFINGKEKKGILFLSRNNVLCFISSEGDDKEIDIILENLKKIYFNVKGGINLKNYEKNNDEERFIQLVEMNDNIKDIKFNNEQDFEYLIKGVIVAFKNKTNGVDKNLIYHIVKSSVNTNNNNTDKSKERMEKSINNNEDSSNYQNYEENEEIIIKEKNNNESKNKNEDDDIIITTTITEVFKDGELINKETREKMDGVVKSLHVYSPDTDEYEVFLKNTKLGQKQLVRRYIDGLPIDSKNDKDDNNINDNEIEVVNNDNEIEVREEFENEQEY